RHGDEQAVRRGEHSLARDGPLDVALEVAEVARATEAGVVGAEVDLGLRLAAGALHAAPPEMTARTSISSPSSTISPSVSSSSPRITIAVPGSTPSSASSLPTDRRPARSTIRR